MIFVFIFGFTYALCRELSEHAKENNFPDHYGPWWNTNTSWYNKHRWRPSWFWKTAGVWATDAEHFFQMLATISILIALYFGQGQWLTVAFFYFGNVLSGAVKELFIKDLR